MHTHTHTHSPEPRKAISSLSAPHKKKTPPRSGGGTQQILNIWNTDHMLHSTHSTFYHSHSTIRLIRHILHSTHSTNMKHFTHKFTPHLLLDLVGKHIAQVSTPCWLLAQWPTENLLLFNHASHCTFNFCIMSTCHANLMCAIRLQLKRFCFLFFNCT